MKISLCLTSGEYVTHHTTVTLPEDNVLLTLSSAVYPVGSLLVTVRKDSTQKQYKYTGDSLDVTEFFTSAGLVEISITLTYRGETAKIWQVEPFVVKEIPGGFIAVPEVESLKERTCRLEAAIKELYNLIADK